MSAFGYTPKDDLVDAIKELASAENERGANPREIVESIFETLAQPEPEGPTDKELLQIAATTIEPYARSGIAVGEYEAETECAVEAYGSELIAFARAAIAADRARLAQPEPQGPLLEPRGCPTPGACSCPTAPTVPPEMIRALELAEAALADIGDADREPGDDLAWAEARAAQDLSRIRRAIARWGRPAIEPVPDAKARELLNLLLDDLDALIDNSEGVTGLHLNGEVASWESLREGGTFETWLMRMDEARAFLDSTMGKPADARPAIEPVPASD